MGTAYLARQDYREAKTELERAVKLNPKLPTVQSLYGRSLFALGDHEAAERAFRKELEFNINDFEANLQLGNMKKAAQKFDEADTYLERATTIRPDDISGRKLLANLRLQTGKTEEAVRLLEAIAAEAPHLVDVHVQLATAYNRLKRTGDAERERAIVDKLNAETQAKQPGSKPGEGPVDAVPPPAPSLVRSPVRPLVRHAGPGANDRQDRLQPGRVPGSRQRLQLGRRARLAPWTSTRS